MARKAAVRRGKDERIEHEQRVSAGAKQPHRKIARGEDVLDVRLESPLGRLNFLGKITKGEYEAGQRYREIAFDYLHAIGAPYPFVQSQAAEFTIAGVMKMPTDQECEKREREYNGAYGALFRAGQRPAVAVKRVAVYEENPRDDYDIDLVKIGLRALSEYFTQANRVASNVIPFSRFMVIA